MRHSKAQVKLTVAWCTHSKQAEAETTRPTPQSPTGPNCHATTSQLQMSGKL